jgi:hypothetical protein
MNEARFVNNPGYNIGVFVELKSTKMVLYI